MPPTTATAFVAGQLSASRWDIQHSGIMSPNAVAGMWSDFLSFLVSEVIKSSLFSVGGRRNINLVYRQYFGVNTRQLSGERRRRRRRVPWAALITRFTFTMARKKNSPDKWVKKRFSCRLIIATPDGRTDETMNGVSRNQKITPICKSKEPPSDQQNETSGKEKSPEAVSLCSKPPTTTFPPMPWHPQRTNTFYTRKSKDKLGDELSQGSDEWQTVEPNQPS